MSDSARWADEARYPTGATCAWPNLDHPFCGKGIAALLGQATAVKPDTEPGDLTALAGGSQHGYAIITDVEQISKGRGRLRAGTLYAALDRLRADGLIEIDREVIVASRLGRYYRLTSTGTQHLAEEAARLQSNADAATSRLGLSGGMATT